MLVGDSGSMEGSRDPSSTPSQAKAHTEGRKRAEESREHGGPGLASPPSKWWHTHSACPLTGWTGVTSRPVKGLHGVQRLSAQAPGPGRSRARCRGAHETLGRHLPSCGPGPGHRRRRGCRGSPGASPADASSLHNSPTLSLRAGCPQAQSSLPPDAKAPAAAPEPGTALTAAGKARFPEATGQRGWWGPRSHRDSGKPALLTLGLQRGGPGNKEESSGDKKGKVGKNGDAREATWRRKMDHQGQKGMETARRCEGARGGAGSDLGKD